MFYQVQFYYDDQPYQHSAYVYALSTQEAVDQVRLLGFQHLDITHVYLTYPQVTTRVTDWE
jgi:hypothetical protein